MRKLAVVMLAALAFGCVGNLNAERLREVQAGMTMEQVTDILGEPYMVSAGVPVGNGPNGPILGTTAMWMRASMFGARSVSLNFDADNRLIKAPVATSLK